MGKAPDPRSPSFGVLLKRYRRSADLSQQALAERAGYSVGHISRLERAARAPAAATVEVLADALGLSESERSAFGAAARPSAAQPIPRSSVSSVAPPPVDLWPVATPPPAGDNLPAHLTPLVGREHEQAAAAHLLSRASVRLLTLTGPGGVGKTRLAVQVAEGLRGVFTDGVCFVALAELTDPSQVLAAIGQALGLRDGTQAVGDTLRAFLRQRCLLLVLDNFEHLLTAAPDVVQTVVACPEVKLLVTSRSPLHVRGEHEMAVSPLNFPDVPDMPAESTTAVSVADLRGYAAITLFVQRAQAVKPTFDLAAHNAGAVAQICRRVDGLPLAIELAAARIRLLTPDMLLARLDRRLEVLTTGAKDLPKRQQTLRATLDWSYQLLEPREQRLLCWLAIFTGGWTLEAAEAICAEAERLGVEPLGTSVLAMLEPLVDNSLVRQSEYPDGSVRYSLLETVREYALEQLAVSGETETLRRAQANYYLSLPEEVAPESLGETVMESLDRLQREHANLRSALSWALERGETHLGLRLADALGRFWSRYGHLREGRGWLEGLLAVAVPGEVPVELRARAVHAAGVLAAAQGDASHATMLLAQAVALYHEYGDIGGAARAINTLGGVAYDQGDLERAATLFEESLALHRQTGDLGEIARELGNLATAIYFLGDLARATALHEEGLALAQQSGRQETVAMQLSNLANLARLQGDLRRAAALQRQSLEIRRPLGDRRWLAINLTQVAAIAAQGGQTERAARLLGAAIHLRTSIGSEIPPPERQEIEQAVAGARATLGDVAWETAMSAGRRLSLEQAIQEALSAADAVAELETVSAPAESPASATKMPPAHSIPALADREGGR